MEPQTVHQQVAAGLPKVGDPRPSIGLLHQVSASSAKQTEAGACWCGLQGDLPFMAYMDEHIQSILKFSPRASLPRSQDPQEGSQASLQHKVALVILQLSGNASSLPAPCGRTQDADKASRELHPSPKSPWLTLQHATAQGMGSRRGPANRQTEAAEAVEIVNLTAAVPSPSRKRDSLGNPKDEGKRSSGRPT